MLAFLLVEPERQLEIQLGHMCNNRCVFCVSGQQTELRQALPVAATPVLERLAQGHAAGMRKVTLLGGEPTLQPEFMRVVRAAVELGFDEIVIFTNGAKTARGEFIDEILATGGRFTWRLSFQGGDALAHERTTKKLGSFARLKRTMEELRARGQTITVNMCVVQSNAGSVERFPELLMPFGVRQLHLDMIRPLDAGVRTELEMRAMIPRYSELAGPLERMVAGFPDGFDVNVGNLPYCVAPAVAPWVHHDGERTMTVAVDGRDSLSEPWDKYAVKARDKVKTERCGECVFDASCSGVYDTYRRFYGMDEFVPVSREALVKLDPARRLFTLHWGQSVRALEGVVAPAGLRSLSVHEDARAGEFTLRWEAEGGGQGVTLSVWRREKGGVAGGEGFAIAVREGRGAVVRAAVEQVYGALANESDAWSHPPGDDALGRGAMAAPLVGALVRLRGAVPFGAMRWREARSTDGGGACVLVFGAAGTRSRVEVTLRAKGGAVSWGYRLVGETGDVERAVFGPGVRAIADALRGAGPGAEARA